MTLYFYNNFGSVLQAYALRNVLHTLTSERVDILPYRPALPEYQYFQDEELKQKYGEKCKKFDIFRREYLGIGDDIVTELDFSVQMASWAEQYDHYIVGSDIVWGKEFSDLDPVYFLHFVPEKKNKIAYAASVILSEEGKTEDDRLFEQWIPHFNAISMRESSSIASIQRFTSKKVTDVLDPTLLLAEADYKLLEIENDEMKKAPYLLSYFLTHDPAVVDYTNMIAAKLNLRVIHYFADYPDCIFSKESGCFAFAGPEEFLGYVRNATCIFTNSFHGTCFAMIYRKPFYTYTAKRAMLSRVRDTVKKLNMEDRFFNNFLDLSKVSLEIDYTKMEECLNYEKDRSLNFLNKVLRGHLYV